MDNTETIESNKQVMTQGTVMFLDALGTKGIWERRSIEEVEHAWIGLNDTLEIFKKFLTHSGINCQMLLLSDTIVLLANTDKLLVVSKMFSAFIAQSILNKVFFRGAISIGQYFYKPGMPLIGPAIDDAAKWHESTNWIGVMLTPNTQKWYETLFNTSQKKGIKLLQPLEVNFVKYKIPYKDECKEHLENEFGYVINWPFIGKVFFDHIETEFGKYSFEEVIKEVFSQTYRGEQIKDDVIIKFNNSYGFYKHVEQEYFAKLHPFEKFVFDPEVLKKFKDT